MKIDKIMLENVKKENIKIICIGTEIGYITDKGDWTYVFKFINNAWELDKIKMKRRYRYGRTKTSHGRHDERQRKNKYTYGSNRDFKNR